MEFASAADGWRVVNALHQACQWMLSVHASVWLLSLALVIIVLYIYGTWTHKHFQRMGVPGPKPLPLLGNLTILLKEGFFCDKRLVKEYGRVFGLYDGIQPVLIISDAELIKVITMQHADHFINHRTDIFNKELDRALVVLKDEDWKSVRSIITPVLNGGKLKKMMPVINQCARECIERMEYSSEKEQCCEIKDAAGRFALDAVGKTLFSIHMDSSKSKEDGTNGFVETASRAFDEFAFSVPSIVIITLFPFMTGLMKKLGAGLLSSKTLQFFRNNVRAILEMRKGMEQKPLDFVQLLLDARSEDKLQAGPDSCSRTKRALTEEEILANCILFFLAGYDTTSTAISFILYHLALYPEVQKRLYDETKEKWDQADLSYDTVFGMRYLDQVYNETFRLFPPALRTDRLCTKDCQVGPYNIKKGQVINISIVGAHYDEDYWPDPLKFDPERFSPENKSNIVPCSFIPFGSGPRGCIGKRLAELLTKTIVIHIVNNFKISVCDKTENPVKLRNLPILVPVNGTWLSLEKRC